MTPYTSLVQSLFIGKGPLPLLWAGPRSGRLKLLINDVYIYSIYNRLIIV